ncbi:MAG: outer membrane protein transport protein [Deltaproteobacteria bacterium]|nr:outer membrane protein transport protein [Deltaproteobacteria bacterium]
MARLPLLAGAPLVCLTLLLQEASGGGYALPYQSAKAVGQGNAMTAGVNDPSAVYANPAALSEVEGNQIQGGLQYINVVSGVTNSGRKSRNQHDDNFIPTLFANYQVPGTDLVMGIGLYTPFGLATSYGERSFTRFGAVRSELRTFYLTPAIAWRVNPSLSVGGGLSFVHSSALFSRALFLGGGAEGKIRLTDTDNGYTFNLGMLLKPDERWKVGITYRGRVDLNYDTADVKVADAAGVVETGKSKGTQIPLPPVISFGLHWQMTREWGVEFAYDYTHWNEFRHLKARFNRAFLGGALRGLFIQERWKDTHTLRLGSNYQLSPAWVARAGIVLDESPIPASTLGPSIPGADTLTVNAGLGYRWDHWSLDVGYAAIFYKNRSVLNNVLEASSSSTLTPGRDRYRTFDNFVSLTLGYKF